MPITIPVLRLLEACRSKRISGPLILRPTTGEAGWSTRRVPDGAADRTRRFRAAVHQPAVHGTLPRMNGDSNTRRRWLLEVAAVFLSCTVVATVVWAIARGASEGSESLAGWIEALSTLGALLAATAAAVFAARILYIEVCRERRVASDLRQHQAARVAGWATVDVVNVLQSGSAWARPRKLYVHLRNASDLPVTNMKVTLQLSGLTADGKSRQTIWGDDLDFDTVPPTDAPFTEERPIPQRFIEAWSTFGGSHPRVKVVVEFTDTNNAVWVRYADGQLKDVTGNRPLR